MPLSKGTMGPSSSGVGNIAGAFGTSSDQSYGVMSTHRSMLSNATIKVTSDPHIISSPPTNSQHILRGIGPSALEGKQDS